VAKATSSPLLKAGRWFGPSSNTRFLGATSPQIRLTIGSSVLHNALCAFYTVTGKKRYLCVNCCNFADLTVLSETVHTQTMQTINKNWEFTLKNTRERQFYYHLYYTTESITNFTKLLLKLRGIVFFRTQCRRHTMHCAKRMNRSWAWFEGL